MRTGVPVLVALLSAPLALQAADAGNPFRPRHFRVDSVPGGADVFVIGGHVGKTPLTLSERDIYPNWYPDAQAHLYGVVRFSKAGCEDFSRRLDLDDINAGIEARLVCGQGSVPDGEVSAAVPAAGYAAPVPDGDAPVPAAIMQRRLRQLRVLQELLDDGLITEQEERSLRKRILAAP